MTVAEGNLDKRDNTQHFLDACRQLHAYFSIFAKEKKYDNTSVPFSEIEPNVLSILSQEGDTQSRIDYWKDYMQKGLLGKHIEMCDDYNHRTWIDEIMKALGSRNATDIQHSNAYLFHAAADYHRHFVLKQLLPEHQVIVA